VVDTSGYLKANHLGGRLHPYPYPAAADEMVRRGWAVRELARESRLSDAHYQHSSRGAVDCGMVASLIADALMRVPVIAIVDSRRVRRVDGIDIA
jgi:hypothetical protein